MASLFRKTLTRYIDVDGNRVRKNTPGARKKKVTLKPWYGKYRDADGIERRTKLSTNKAAARQMLAELERDAELRKAGLKSPFEEQARRPLVDHLRDFERNLFDRGNTEAHCLGVTKRASRIVSECGFRFVGDISASRVQSFLSQLKDSGLAQQTVNHYLRAIKQFSRWLVRDQRSADDRLAYLIGGNVKTDLRIERRELTSEEIEWLLDQTYAGPSRMGLTGHQRFLLYAAAIGTGLRASELASLTPLHFELTTDPPTVRIDASDEKARRGDVLPLPADLAALLLPVLEPMTAERSGGCSHSMDQRRRN
jgi:integrase